MAKKKRCVMPDCKFVPYKGRLCRKHWDAVPLNEKLMISSAAAAAAFRAGVIGHRRIERELLARHKSAKSLT